MADLTPIQHRASRDVLFVSVSFEDVYVEYIFANTRPPRTAYVDLDLFVTVSVLS